MADKKEKSKSSEDKARGEKHKKANLSKGKKGSKDSNAAVPKLKTGDIEKLTEPPRLKTYYLKEILPGILKDSDKSNVSEIPKLKKIIVNMGVSEAKDNIQALDNAKVDLTAIAGQLAEVRRAKKSISNFKLREGMPIGVRVTLRGDRMYEFLDRLITTAVPRLRDFRGLPYKGFDGNGNYNLGLREHHIFAEVDLERSPKSLGMNITFVTSAKNDDDGLDLLGRFGMPFKKKDAGAKG
jgi:large subunit ribosomal protein L5